MVPAQLFRQQQRAQQQREKRLRLQHQRGEPGGHAELDGEKQKGELAKADGHAVDHQPAQRNSRARDKKDCRKRHQGKAQARQQEGRHALQAEFDHHEINAPRHHDAERQQHIFS